MPLVFFSGGIDSTVLAFDVAMNPFRYGIDQVDDKHCLFLLSYTGAGGTKQKKAALQPLVRRMQQRTQFDVVHRVVELSLEDRPRKKSPRSWQTLAPLFNDFQRSAMPFTPGLHVWLASHAINVLARSTQDDDGVFTSEQAFFGFQFEGPSWQKIDDGDFPANDTSTDFVRSLNEVTEASDEDVWFRAPFLDNRMHKAQIAEMGKSIGVPLELTSSCVEGWMKKCGKCPQCMIRSTLGI